MSGKYMSFGKVWQDEGSDPVAFDVATNVLEGCMQKHSAGKTLYGMPFIRLHPQKKHPEFLVIDESVQFNDKEVWGHKDVAATLEEGSTPSVQRRQRRRRPQLSLQFRSPR